MSNGLIQMIRMDKSTGQKRVHVYVKIQITTVFFILQAWLNPDPVLNDYLRNSFCPGLYTYNKYRNYDHIQLITG